MEIDILGINIAKTGFPAPRGRSAQTGRTSGEGLARLAA
ncbi:hypothetical protein P3T23_007001 [Paraburkholderia sp. GAS448]